MRAQGRNHSSSSNQALGDARVRIPLTSGIEDLKYIDVDLQCRPNKILDAFLEKAPEEIQRKFNGRLENISLILTKFLPVFDGEMEVSFNGQRKKKEEREVKANIKRVWLSIAEIYRYSKLERGITCKRIDIFKELEQDGYTSYSFGINTTSPLIVGLGSQHVFETAITLHHVFGVPYIPGSALKGIVRAAAFWELAEKLRLSSDKELNDLYNDFYKAELFKESSIKSDDLYTYKLLFGAQNFKGLLTFLDAYLDLDSSESPFKLDIMNPHYGKYYQDKKAKQPPADYLDPTPIPFLTLRPGVKFIVVVLFDRYRWERRVKGWLEKQERQSYLDVDSLKDLLEELLKKAFSELGAGAKTRLGYGLGELFEE